MSKITIMPATRRFRLSIILLVITIFVLIYINTGVDRTQSNAFYTRTSEALSQREAEEKDGRGIASDDASVQRRLREAADKAKEAADKKGTEFHGQEVKKAAEKANVAEDVKEDFEEAKIVEKVELKNKDVVMPQEKSEEVLAEEKAKEDAARAARAKVSFDGILKKSPIIIFSKTYCPFSRKAKHILGSLYKITPSPYVVELNENEIGPDLQQLLGEVTGRRTVPNVLVNGKSIGGGDDIEQLHMSGKLKSKIEGMLGNRVKITAVKEEDLKET